ncbi:hypothetical protein SUGI_0663030 [Cryptomeria japonica]|nr:hypothetical protein SUGI_0663030 [Cryptomeria japonica]
MLMNQSKIIVLKYFYIWPSHSSQQERTHDSRIDLLNVCWKHNYIAVRIRFLYVEIASAFLNTVLVR